MTPELCKIELPVSDDSYDFKTISGITNYLGTCKNTAGRAGGGVSKQQCYTVGGE